MSSFDEEDLEWNTSKIKGFSFGDDDETPWAELSKYQTISEGASGGEISSSASGTSLISFEPTDASSAVSSGLVSDKVKKAVRIFSVSLPASEPEHGALTITEAVGSESTELLPSDSRELKAELSKCRRHIAWLEQSRYKPLHPKETVLNIFLGKSFGLEFYKTFQDKKDLIDEAIKLQDGNAILTVTLFLWRTLSNSKFLELMSTRPEAVRHLTNFLIAKGQLSDAANVLTLLGQHEQAALIHYKLVCSSPEKDSSVRIRKIKATLQNYFYSLPDSVHVKSHILLLERLAPVIEVDTKNPGISSDPAFRTLLDKEESVLRSLLYLCYFHYNESENLLSSPLGLKKIHQLGEQQFTWIALLAQAHRKDWKECENLALARGWLGGKKLKSFLDAKEVARILYQNGAPTNVLQQYLSLIEDLEIRESHAKRYNVPSAVIECYVASKDRQALLRYRDRLEPNSRDWLEAENALKMHATKWKN